MESEINAFLKEKKNIERKEWDAYMHTYSVVIKIDGIPGLKEKSLEDVTTTLRISFPTYVSNVSS